MNVAPPPGLTSDHDNPTHHFSAASCTPAAKNEISTTVLLYSLLPYSDFVPHSMHQV